MYEKNNTQRLDKLLSNSGYGTRSEIKKLIKAGLVKIDEIITDNPSQHVNPGNSKIEIDGKLLNYKKYIYIMMNKPAGVISATQDTRLKTAIDLLPPEFTPFNPFPAGRLDIDTEGFLLLTNDGQLAHNLLSPRKHVAKRYFAIIRGIVTDEDVEHFKKGVVLDDGYNTMPAELKIQKRYAIANGREYFGISGVEYPAARQKEYSITNRKENSETYRGEHFDISGSEGSEIELVLHEGKFHQVKRMFEAVGKSVVYLKRIQIGGLKLDESLKPGECRELTAEETELLKSPTK